MIKVNVSPEEVSDGSILDKGLKTKLPSKDGRIITIKYITFNTFSSNLEAAVIEK